MANSLDQHSALRKMLTFYAATIGVTAILIFPGLYFFVSQHNFSRDARLVAVQIAETVLQVKTEKPIAWSFMDDHLVDVLELGAKQLENPVQLSIFDVHGNAISHFISGESVFSITTVAIIGSPTEPEGRVEVITDTTPLWAGTGIALLLGLIFGGIVFVVLQIFPMRALITAQKYAVEANLAKSRFLAMMSHEIRTPMNGVLSMAEMLEFSGLDDERLRKVRIIRSSAAELLEIINDILDFSKIEARQMNLNVTEFGFEEIIDNVVDLMAVPTAEQGNQLTAVVDPAVPNILVGDPGRIRQILTNLLGNANKFTKNGRVFVSISAEPTDDEKMNISVVVRDSGVGISKIDHFKLFRPFDRGNSASRHKFSGTGLGLSITQSFVNSMGGTIDFDSAPGKGSTFKFNILLDLPENPKDEKMPDLANVKLLFTCSNPDIEEAGHIYFTRLGAELTGSQDIADVIFSDFPQAKNNLNIESTKKTILISNFEPPSTNRVDSPYLAVVPSPFTWANVGSLVAAATGHDDAVEILRNNARLMGAEVTQHYAPPDRWRAQSTDTLILVAEDHPTNRTVISLLLNDLGYVADFAKNGKEAFNMLRETRYGLLLTDCQMPEMSGYELALAVRALETDETRIPIIALTADIFPETQQRCVDVGMDDFLVKPILRETIDVAILNQLPKAGALRQPIEVVAAPPMPETEGRLEKQDLNVSYLMSQVLAGDESLLRPTLDDFVQSTEPLIEDLKTALGTDDRVTAQRISHTIKGAARMAGAEKLADFCHQGQVLLDAKDLVAAKALLEDQVDAFEQVRVAIENY